MSNRSKLHVAVMSARRRTGRDIVAWLHPDAAVELRESDDPMGDDLTVDGAVEYLDALRPPTASRQPAPSPRANYVTLTISRALADALEWAADHGVDTLRAHRDGNPKEYSPAQWGKLSTSLADADDAIAELQGALRASTTPAVQDHLAPTARLQAIRARIMGEFDNPALVAWGPLSDTLRDIERIALAEGE